MALHDNPPGQPKASGEDMRAGRWGESRVRKGSTQGALAAVYEPIINKVHSIQRLTSALTLNATINATETTTSTMHREVLYRGGVTEPDAGVPLGLTAIERRF